MSMLINKSDHNMNVILAPTVVFQIYILRMSYGYRSFKSRKEKVLCSHFIFLLNLPLDFLWDTFFQNGELSNYSIYVHSEPGFVFNQSTTRSSFFHNRQLVNSIKVAWGESTMIDAERLLLQVALENPSNQRFLLLSDRSHLVPCFLASSSAWEHFQLCQDPQPNAK
ncbi:transferase [Lithospermum erythrorhizon]|uniref:Transferase n=1 Tax=Lithospermum erythrorhizon TaxID=34254 RepID=A0AAV3PPD3_LITER